VRLSSTTRVPPAASRGAGDSSLRALLEDDRRPYGALMQWDDPGQGLTPLPICRRPSGAGQERVEFSLRLRLPYLYASIHAIFTL
jgi:hypothetical protein